VPERDQGIRAPGFHLTLPESLILEHRAKAHLIEFTPSVVMMMLGSK
jgi:hypothetical protein